MVEAEQNNSSYLDYSSHSHHVGPIVEPLLCTCQILISRLKPVIVKSHGSNSNHCVKGPLPFNSLCLGV